MAPQPDALADKMFPMQRVRGRDVQDDIVAKLTQQNATLRAQAAAGGHADEAGSPTGTSSRKLSAMLAASEKRAADSLARVQALLKREVRATDFLLLITCCVCACTLGRTLRRTAVCILPQQRVG